MRSSYDSSQIAQQFINCCAFYEFTKCAAQFINCANSQLREQGIPSDRSRPGDIYHPDFHLGRPAYFDLSVRSTTQSAVISSASSQAGVAAAVGEIAKDNQYQDIVNDNGGDFIPLVCETFGVWSPYALSILGSIADRTTVRNGLPRKFARRQLLQQLSVTLWRYNAKMILHQYSLTAEDELIS